KPVPTGSGIDVHMYFALGEIVGGSRVTLATGDDQIRRVDSGPRIGRAQDLVNSVTTRAVGGQRRTVLGGQPVVALEESLHPIGGQIVFGVHPLRGMAITANN